MGSSWLWCLSLGKNPAKMHKGFLWVVSYSCIWIYNKFRKKKQTCFKMKTPPWSDNLESFQALINLVQRFKLLSKKYTLSTTLVSGLPQQDTTGWVLDTWSTSQEKSNPRRSGPEDSRKEETAGSGLWDRNKPARWRSANTGVEKDLHMRKAVGAGPRQSWGTHMAQVGQRPLSLVMWGIPRVFWVGVWHGELLEDHSGDFPGGSVIKSPPASAGDTGLIPSPGRFLMQRDS